MFLPLPKQHSGSPTGNSYLSLWTKCKRKWFYEYLWPHSDGSVGLAPTTTKAPLLLGSMLHAGKEVWFTSGVRDGEDTGHYDLEAALAAVDALVGQRAREWADDATKAEHLAMVRQWLVDWHRHFGPEGYTPLWPETKVLCLEDGRPAAELEITVPLGFEDYVYTCRADLVSLYQDRYVRVEEHKTSAPSFVDKLLNSLPKSSQFTGEMFALTHAFGESHPIDCIRVHAHIKGWTPKSKFSSPVKFGTTTRTPAQLERFRLRAVSILGEIQTAVEAFEAGRAAGVEVEVLADHLFPEVGEHTGACYDFNSTCEFEGICRLGARAGTLGGFRSARTPKA